MPLLHSLVPSWASPQSPPLRKVQRVWRMVPRQVDSTGRVPDGEEKSGPRKSTCNVNQKNSCKICEDKTIVTYEVMQDFCIKSMGIRAFSKNRNPHIAVLHAFPVVCLALTEKRATLHLCNDEFLDEKRNGNRNSEFGILISLQKFLFQTPKMLQHLCFFSLGFLQGNLRAKKQKTKHTLLNLASSFISREAWRPWSRVFASCWRFPLPRWCRPFHLWHRDPSCACWVP